MSGYNIDCFLRDFAKRTLDNIKIVEAAESGYEVTQLINSFLGLIIIPVEYSKKDKGGDDGELQKKSQCQYKVIEEIIDKCIQSQRLYSSYLGDWYKEKKFSVAKYIRHIRNAVAHGGNEGIHFQPITVDNEIKHIVFYDTYWDKETGRNYEFCTKLSIDELRNLSIAIAYLYSDYAGEKEGNNKGKMGNTPRQRKYLAQVKRMENLLKNS